MKNGELKQEFSSPFSLLLCIELKIVLHFDFSVLTSQLSIFTGSETTNLVPLPLFGAASIFPPCAVTIP